MKSQIFILFVLILTGCEKKQGSKVESPGQEKTTKTEILETGADLLQGKTPLKQFNTYLDGFHFYNGNMNEQMEAHHYCQQLNEDLIQCIIFDGNGENAKLMGVEYIVTATLFEKLPEEEKRMWHSHHHEVKSGTLVAPGIPDAAEHELMEKIVSTYGKTFHTWHTDQQLTLPIGFPQIMMGFTKDGQIKDSLLIKRDKSLNISTSAKRNKREDIPVPKIIPGANAWENGEVRQLELTRNPVRTSHH